MVNDSNKVGSPSSLFKHEYQNNVISVYRLKGSIFFKHHCYDLVEDCIEQFVGVVTFVVIDVFLLFFYIGLREDQKGRWNRRV